MTKFDNFKQYIEARGSFSDDNEALEYLQLHYLIKRPIKLLLRKLKAIDDECIHQEISMLLTKHKEFGLNIQPSLSKFSYGIWEYAIDTSYVRNIPNAKMYLHKLYDCLGQSLNNPKSRKQFVLLTAFQIATLSYDGNDLKELYSIIAQKEPLYAKQIFKFVNTDILYILKESNSNDALERFKSFAQKYI